MSQTCSNLATKADLEALAAELEALLEGKIDNVERASIITAGGQNGLALALTALLPQVRQALAGIAALAARLAPILGQLAFLAAQIAALLLIQYQVTRNSQKIESNRRAIERNTARSLDNRDEIERNRSELARQNSEIEALKTQIPQIRREIAANNQAIAQNDRAIAQNDRDIAANKQAIIVTKAQLEANIANAEQRLEQEIRDAENRLQADIAVAETRLNAKISDLRNFVETIRVGFQVSIADIRARFTAQIQSISATLARTQGDLTETRVRLGIANGDITLTRRRVRANESDIASLRARGIGGGVTTTFTQTLNNTATTANTNTANITNTNSQVQNLTSRLTALETAQMDTTQVQNLRSDISTNVEAIVAASLGTLVLPRLNELRTQTSPSAISSATNNALCQQATNPSSCLNTNFFSPIQNNLGNILNGIGAGTGAVNTALNNQILGRVTDIQAKVNNSQFGLQATKQFLNNAWNSTIIDKSLNAMNTALAFHNAVMLSRNLGQSVNDVISLVLNGIGVQDSNNQAIDVNAFVTQKVTQFVDATIGAENAETLTNGLNSANRILTAGQGVISSVRGIKDAIANGQEIIANRVGTLGNNFMLQGILEENSFPWMDTNINFRNPFARFVTRVENLQQIVDETNELVQTGIEVQQGFQEITENLSEFQSGREQLEESLSEFNLAKQEEEDTEEFLNQSPDIDNSDLIEAEPSEEG